MASKEKLTDLVKKEQLETLIGKALVEPDFLSRLRKDPEATLMHEGVEVDEKLRKMIAEINWRGNLSQQLNDRLSKSNEGSFVGS